jgi:chromosome segregation ATPase
MESTRAADLVQVQSEWENFKSEVEGVMEQHQFKLDKVEEFERNIGQFGMRLEESAAQLKQHNDEMHSIVKQELNAFGITQRHHANLLNHHNETLSIHQGQMDLLNSRIQEIDGLERQVSEQLKECQRQLVAVESAKTEQSKFD